MFIYENNQFRVEIDPTNNTATIYRQDVSFPSVWIKKSAIEEGYCFELADYPDESYTNEKQLKYYQDLFSEIEVAIFNLKQWND